MGPPVMPVVFFSNTMNTMVITISTINMQQVHRIQPPYLNWSLAIDWWVPWINGSVSDSLAPPMHKSCLATRIALAVNPRCGAAEFRAKTQLFQVAWHWGATCWGERFPNMCNIWPSGTRFKPYKWQLATGLSGLQCKICSRASSIFNYIQRVQLGIGNKHSS